MKEEVTFLFRIIEANPVHVRVRIWAGPRKGSRGLAGVLVFRNEDWYALRDILEKFPQVEFEHD